jgi:hypothetical protein
MKRTRRLVMTVWAPLTAVSFLAGPSTPSVAQVAEPLLSPELAVHLNYLSGYPMFLVAESLGITEIMGKSITTPSETTHNSPKRLIDVPIGAHPTKHENEPTVATSPKDKKKLVAGSHFFGPPPPVGNRCLAFTSSDGGETWSAGLMMTQLTPASTCSDPVLAYSPDGSRVYYAYMDIKFSDFDILVSYSNDDGATWSAPVIALNSVPGMFTYDKPWIATPLDDSNFVYVTATRFDAGFGFPPVGANCHIVFTRSADAGVSYGPPVILESSTASCGVGPSPVLQGSRPAGGKDGNLLVGWYNSGSDGWLSGSFKIRTRHSADFGVTFAPAVDAVIDSFEAPFFKGPLSCYERWWGVMFPDVEIDASGSAHIGYTHDPVANLFGVSTTAEDGDIRYVTSMGPPYTAWSLPVTVNDDGTGAQGYVAIDTQSQQTGQGATLHAIWMDHRLPLSGLRAAPQCRGDLENLEYDIFYSTKPPGEGWRANVRVTEMSSISDFLFLGDYNDLSTDNGSLYAVWTDRRDKLSIIDLEDDVWGSRTHREH